MSNKLKFVLRGCCLYGGPEYPGGPSGSDPNPDAPSPSDDSGWEADHSSSESSEDKND